MVEGKESVAYAMPFCAGTVTGMLLQKLVFMGTEVPVLAAAAAPLAALMLASAMLYRMSGGHDPGLWLSASVLFFTGIFCVFSYYAASPAPGDGLVLHWAGICAEHLKGMIESLPFSDHRCNALASALITGDRTLLSEEVTESFRASGASHLLALSGMHLGIIYTIMSKPFHVLRKSAVLSALRFAAIISATLFYTMMTGASPSTVRAFLFITMNEAAILTGRRRKAAGALCAALTVQCALNPEVMLSASFQLSYLAVCGIITLYPKMRDLFPYDKNGNRFASLMRRIWDSASLTISCQIFTGPLAWWLFGSAPMYFLLANLIAVPLTTLSIFLVTALLLLDAVGLLPGIAVRATEFAVRALLFSMEVIGGL